MYYKFNSKTLEFEKTNVVANRNRVIISLLFGFIVLPIILGLSRNEKPIVEKLSIEEKLIVIKDHNEFSEEKLVKELKELNFNYPYIVLAQSKLESNYYSSPIFLENHNLFGLKQATIRITRARGTNRGHAYYDNWKECVYDYGFYQSRYLEHIKTEEQYFDYLGQNYAEDPKYVSKLKYLIEKENLKELFK